MNLERLTPAALPGDASGRPIDPEAALQLTDRGRELLGLVRRETGEHDRASPTDAPHSG